MTSRSKPMVHVAESTHWYSRDGEPVYEVQAAKGGMRPTTLRDARKLNLVPSVTTVIRCAAAPGLERWKQQQVLMAALTLPKIENEPENVYLQRILADSQEQANKARDRGTSIHAAIQGSLQNEKLSPEMDVYAEGAREAIGKWIDVDFECCVAESPFAHELGFGGKCDLLGTSPYFVVDFKTKEFDPEDKLQVWDEHAMQLAAYRHGLGMEGARCAIVYVSVTYPGLARLIEVPQDELAKGWKCFYSLLHFWQAKSGYVSAFERLAA